MGKTSLVVRYCKDEFNEKEQSTIQASHLTKRLAIGDCNVMLNVWVSQQLGQLRVCSPTNRLGKQLPHCSLLTRLQDTAGQERFHALGPIYYRDAGTYPASNVDSLDGILVVTHCRRRASRVRYYRRAVIRQSEDLGACAAATAVTRLNKRQAHPLFVAPLCRFVS